jgi:uncharacterized membrane protein YbhN (UPF0104 family)
VLQTLRWRIIIRALGGKLSAMTAWLIVLIGMFFNQTLPSTVGGDGMRIWRAHKAGLRLGPAASGVVLDRLAGMAGLLVVSALGLPVLFSIVGDSLARWAIPAVVVAGACGYAVLMTIDRLPARLLSWRAFSWAVPFAADARRVFLKRRTSAVILGLSIINHLAIASLVLIIARGMGIAVGTLECLVLVPPVMLVSSLPISVAGWGVREGAMVTAFGFAGVAESEAVALGVLFGLVVLVVGLPGGLIWFLTGRERARPQSLESASDTDSAISND